MELELDLDTLRTTARELVGPGRGILAADESTGTIHKRFDAIGLESTEETRRDYRQMLFTTPGIGEHISGVILFDETIRQSTDDGVPFVRVLQDAGPIPGIKVDLGAKPFALFPGETITAVPAARSRRATAPRVSRSCATQAKICRTTRASSGTTS